MVDSRGRWVVVSFFSLLAVISALAISIGFFQFVILPAGLIGLVVFGAFLRGNARLAEFMLLFAAIAYVILSFLWPRYVAFWVPGLPSINMQRIANIAVLFVMFSSLFSVPSFRSKIGQSFRDYPFFWICFLLFEVFRFISIFFSSDFGVSVYQYINEIFVHAVFVFLGVFLGSSIKYFEIFVIAVSFCLVASFAVALIEVVRGGNLFAAFVDPDNAYVQWALSNKVRGGAYRAQSTFGHPLTYAEFASVALGISLCVLCFGKFGTKKVLVALALVGAAIGGVLLSRSRAGYAAAAVAGSLIFTAPFFSAIIRKTLSLRSATFWALSSSLVLTAVAAVAYVVVDHAFGSQSYDVSNSARITMFVRGWDLLLQSPIVGYGVGLAAEVIGVRAYSGVSRYTVDSLILSYAVDSGFVALLSFLGCVFAVLISALASLRNSSEKYWYIWYSMIASVLSFFVFKVILSLSDNNFFMYIIFGLIVSALSRSTSKIANPPG
ncbi:O-antigen ligase family protein [Methyloversatilis sp. NSM2]|uniref:O-antigen ligase family protein n=1 Tax=Methyloversatilis sp. NSM2 TaxID=3134135 RepID=UPI0031166331